MIGGSWASEPAERTSGTGLGEKEREGRTGLIRVRSSIHKASSVPEIPWCITT